MTEDATLEVSKPATLEVNIKMQVDAERGVILLSFDQPVAVGIALTPADAMRLACLLSTEAWRLDPTQADSISLAKPNADPS